MLSHIITDQCDFKPSTNHKNQELILQSFSFVTFTSLSKQLIVPDLTDLLSGFLTQSLGIKNLKRTHSQTSCLIVFPLYLAKAC